MDLFSSRRRAITAKTAELIAAFEARFGRAPNALELDRLPSRPPSPTRQAKSHDGETREAAARPGDAQLRAEIAGGLAGVAADALGRARDRTGAATLVAARGDRDRARRRPGRARRPGPAPTSPARSPPRCRTTSASPTAPTSAGCSTSSPTRPCARRPAGRAPGPATTRCPTSCGWPTAQSAYQAAGAQLYVHARSTCAPSALLAATTARRRRGAAATEVAQRFLDGLREPGIELGADQAAAVRGVLTSGARVETLVGPAGTGKSFVVGALARAWTDPGLRRRRSARRVFGLATSQIATDVLADEGLTARNIARWLATQDRLAAGPGSADRSPTGDDEAWRLRAGDLVVVDESAMADTAALAAIHRHVDAAGAKLLLVGDHRQLAAVGAGGGMDLLAAGRRPLRAGRGPPVRRTTGSARRRCGCATATRPCCASTTSTAGCSTPAPPSRPRPPPPAPGSPTRSPGGGRC